MGERIWFNGDLVPRDGAMVSVFDRGLTVGDGVFETLVTYGGVPFAFDLHYQRLVRSAEKIGLDGVPSEAVLRDAADEVVSAWGADRVRLRITVTGGESPMGSPRSDSTPNVVVAGCEFVAYGATADVVVVPFVRNERGALAGVKATSYGENVVALAYAKRRGGSEAVFGNTLGNLCEGTGSNIFVVYEGRLITPPLASGCLAGVTREVVVEVCRKNGIEVFEEDFPLKRLAEVEEAFLTSTTREVQPVARVDAKLLGNHVPGDVTARVGALFEGFVRA